MSTPNARTPTDPFDLYFADLEEEFAATRRLLGVYPDGHEDWKPHEKSMSLSTLAAHIAELPKLAAIIASEDAWDMGKEGYTPTGATTREEILAVFESTAAAAAEAIAGLAPEDLARSWKMHDGETVFMEGPRGPLLRQFLISHTAHHRGQLTVYLRQLGVALPGIYGPTADRMG